MKNLTPNPFPRGKGNRSIWSSLFGRRNGAALRILFPFPRGKGLGVRFFSFLILFAAGCAQVHEQMFTLDCAVGRTPLAGELAPGTAMALDVATSPVPLLYPPHRAIARCDNTGAVTLELETPVDTGLSQLSTPLSTAASHITYAP